MDNEQTILRYGLKRYSATLRTTLSETLEDGSVERQWRECSWRETSAR